MTQIQDDIVEYLNEVHDKLITAVRSSTSQEQVQQMLGEIAAKRDEFNQRVETERQTHSAQTALLSVIDDVRAKLVDAVGSSTAVENVKEVIVQLEAKRSEVTRGDAQGV